MNLYGFSLTLQLIATITATSDTTEPFSLERIGELEGLRFERIGELNRIVKRHSLKINFDVQEQFDNLEKDFRRSYIEIEKVCVSQNKNCDLEKLTETFQRKKSEIHDLLGTKKRRKRDIMSLIGLMSSQDGTLIENDLKQLFVDVNKHHEYLRFLHIYIKNLTNFSEDFMFTLEESTMQGINMTKDAQISALIHDMIFKMSNFDLKLRSIYQVMINKKMDSEVFSIDEFKKALNNITRSLNGTDKVISFKTIREMYNNIETRYKVNEGNLIFEMQIPIVEDHSRSLYKIKSLPFQGSDDKLFLLDTQWSHVANDSEHIAYFLSLDTCLKTNEIAPTYFCDLQSPLHVINSTECLAKAFNDRKIDFDSCESMIRGVKFSQLTFIHNGNNEYFYFANRAEKLLIYCQGNEYEKILTDKMGIIKLSPGCSIISDQVKLFANHPTKSLTVSGDLNVSFDTESFDEKVKLIRTKRFSMKPHYDSIKALNEVFSNSNNPNDYDVTMFGTYTAQLPWMGYLALLAVVLIGFLRCYCKFRKSSSKF